jgi:enamine deaminase RidA (YjgF/YER057c/UK114 family)
MIPFDVLVFPGAAHPRDCLDELRAKVVDTDAILSLTFFVAACDENIGRLVREKLGNIPVSVVAQAPLGGHAVALEAAVLFAPARVSRKASAGLPYTVVSGNGVHQVHAGGISAIEPRGDVAAQAREAFGRMEAILRRERMSFDHVVRQWNYIEDVLDVRNNGSKGQQAYQLFNDVRTLAYSHAEFPAGYPAATGIGQSSGGVLLEFVAVDAPPDVRVVPLSNPKQTDAHDYSERELVGESIEELPVKSTPKFERAKLVARGEQGTIFVSGTAAILGEKSVDLGDVAAQTRTTIENITALVGDRPLSRLRAYVKRPEHLPEIRSICEDAFGPIPALYVQADVCRDELLVELEGAWVGEVGPGETRAEEKR